MDNITSKISRITLGTWAIGGPSFENGTIPSGWSPIDKNEVIEAINYAYENGINHFDTADCYGNGQAERLLNQALGNKIKNVIISDKVGFIANEYSNGYFPQNIIQQCENSLTNLGRDYIDVYYFHHSNFGQSDFLLDDALETFYRLKEVGKIRAIGLSTYSNKAFKRLMPKIKPNFVQCKANIMDYHFLTKNSPLQQLCSRYNTSIIPYQPLNQGLLLGKYSTRNIPNFGNGDHRAKLEKFTYSYLERIEPCISKLLDRYGNKKDELIATALNFVLSFDNVVSTAVGFRNVQQVKEILAKTPTTKLNGNDFSFLKNIFRDC